MARYMTKADRENIVKLCTVEGTLKIMVHEMAEHERPKEWLKALRMAHTWAGKANQLMADDCSDEELKKLWKYFEKFEMRMIPNHEAKKMIEDEYLAVVPSEGLKDMAEAVLSSQCEGCSITDHRSCKYRKALMAVGTASFEDEIPDERCQYKH